MKFLIVGRTATGKDALAKILEGWGWKFVKSYTTREKRYPAENTHKFITEEEFSKFNKDDIVAYTEINGCKYFATVNQIESADAYIIDPNGLNQLLKNMPTEKFTIIYISPKDEELHKNAAMERGDSKKDFKKRVISEDDEFTKFENDLDTYTYMYNNNIYDCIRFINDYTPDVIEYFAYTLDKIKEYSKYVFTK